MSGELAEVAEALVIQPGDTLILRIAGAVTAAQDGHIREHVMQLLPQLADVLIAQCDQLAVFRPDEIKEEKWHSASSPS